MLKKLLALVLTALLCGAAQARTVEQYLFADESIGIYSEMREALNLPPHPEPFEGADILKFYLSNSVRQSNIYRMEANRLKKYDKSKDAGIKQATVLLSSGIFLILSASENLSNYIEKVLNNPSMLSQQGTVSRKMAELTDAADTAWQTYAKTAASGVTYALVDTPRSIKEISGSQNKAITNLLVNQTELDQLKAHLTRAFGPVIADNSQAKWADLPAISLWKFLNDKWTPAPD